MVMKRTKDPWMKADEFGRALPKGVGVNLLVRELDQQVAFCREVIGCGDHLTFVPGNAS